MWMSHISTPQGALRIISIRLRINGTNVFNPESVLREATNSAWNVSQKYRTLSKYSETLLSLALLKSFKKRFHEICLILFSVSHHQSAKKGGWTAGREWCAFIPWHSCYVLAVPHRNERPNDCENVAGTIRPLICIDAIGAAKVLVRGQRTWGQDVMVQINLPLPPIPASNKYNTLVQGRKARQTTSIPSICWLQRLTVEEVTS